MNDPTAAKIHLEIAMLLQERDRDQQHLQAIENQLLVLRRVLEPPKPEPATPIEEPEPRPDLIPQEPS